MPRSWLGFAQVRNRVNRVTTKGKSRSRQVYNNTDALVGIPPRIGRQTPSIVPRYVVEQGRGRTCCPGENTNPLTASLSPAVSETDLAEESKLWPNSAMPDQPAQLEIHGWKSNAGDAKNAKTIFIRGTLAQPSAGKETLLA